MVGSEADLPAESLEASRVLAAEGGWGKTVGFSPGVLLTDEPPPSKVNTPSPSSCARGDGTDLEPSGSLEESQAHLFSLFTFVHDSSSYFACSRQNSKTFSSVSMWQTAFLVLGFCGIRLHPCFFDLHCW